MLEMIGRDPALAGVMGEPAEVGPSVQGPHGVRRQGAEAHGRDVEQGHAVGLRTVRPTHIDARRTVRFGHRGGGMDEVFVADGVDIAFGAERLLAVDSLRTLVHDRADVAVERSAVPVALDEVLLEFRPERFEQEAQMPDHRVVAQDRVLRLNQVIDRHGDDGQNHSAEHPPRPRPHSGSPPDGHQDDEGCCDRQETSHRVSSPLKSNSRPCGAASVLHHEPPGHTWEGAAGLSPQSSAGRDNGR
jgi:hypothetical protein